MKKTVLVLIAFMAISGAAFGQSFTAQSVSGRVERETGNGRWEAVKAGETLSAETTIRTGIGAALTLASGGRTFSIGAVQTGNVASLAGNAAGIRIDGRVVQTDTGEVSRTTGRVSTASARASDAAAEEDIAAE
jgi:curli biogenesis system outer membrane secretion channel CsgG